MRKLFWMIVLIGGYFWLVTSGREDFVLEQGKAFYRAWVAWFEEAQIDFHMKKEKVKKHSRRWD